MTFLSYLALFLTAFGAATILPGFSEALLTAQLLEHAESWVPILLVAATGNTLGGVANWLLGRFLLHWQDRKWFPVSRRRLDQASGLFQRHGYPLLLLSWVPIIGDPLTVAAGVLRARFLPFLILVLIGKTARYAAIAWVVLNGLEPGA